MPAAISSSRNLTSTDAYEAALKNATRIEKAVRMERNGQKVVDLPRYLAAFQQLTDRALQRHEDGVSPALRRKHTELLSRLQKLEPQVAALSTSKAVATVPLAFGLAKDWPWKRVAKYAAGGAIALAALPWCYSQFNHIAKVAENLGSNLKAASHAAQNMQESAAPIVAAGHNLFTQGTAAAGVPYAAVRGGLEVVNKGRRHLGLEPWALPEAPRSREALSGLGMSTLAHNAGLGILLAGSGFVSKYAAVPFRHLLGHPTFADPKNGPGTLGRVIAALGLVVVNGNAIWPGSPNDLLAFLEAHSNTTIATMAAAGLTYATGCSTPTVAFATLAPAVANIVSQQSIGNKTIGEWAAENPRTSGASIGTGVLGHWAASHYLAYQAAHQTAPAIATTVRTLVGAHGKGAVLGAMKQAAAGAISNGPLAAAQAATEAIRPKLFANLGQAIGTVRTNAWPAGGINQLSKQQLTEALAGASITEAMTLLDDAANFAANDPNLLHLVQESATAAYTQGGIEAARDVAAEEAVFGTYFPGGLNGVATAAAKSAAGNGGSWRNHAARMGTAFFGATVPTLTRLTTHLAWEHPLEAATLTLGAAGTTAASHLIRNRIAHSLAMAANTAAGKIQGPNAAPDYSRIFKAAKRMLNFFGQGGDRAGRNAAKAAGNVMDVARRAKPRGEIRSAVQAVRLPSERRVAGLIVGTGVAAAAIPAAIRLTQNSYNHGILGDLVSTANQNRPETAAITATVLPAGAALVNGHRHGFGTVWTKRFGLLSFLPSFGYGLHRLHESRYVQNTVMDSYNNGNLGALVSTANQNRPETAAITATVLPAGTALVNGARHGFGTVWTKRFGLLSFIPSLGYGLHKVYETGYVQNKVMDSYNDGNLGALVSTVNEHPLTTTTVATAIPAALALTNGFMYGFTTQFTKRAGLLSGLPSLGYGLHWLHQAGYLQQAASTAIDWAKDTVFTYPSTAIGLTTGMIFGSEVGFPAFFLTYGANCVRNSWNEGYLGQFYTWSTSGWS